MPEFNPLPVTPDEVSDRQRATFDVRCLCSVVDLFELRRTSDGWGAKRHRGAAHDAVISTQTTKHCDSQQCPIHVGTQGFLTWPPGRLSDNYTHVRLI